MPIAGAILGAVLTGLFYWLMWGGGLNYIDARLQQSRDRKRDLERRAGALENQRMAPLRSICDARDGAVLLMLLVASQRGVPTPEQLSAIEGEMRDVLGFGSELSGRLQPNSPPSRCSRRRRRSTRSYRCSEACSRARNAKTCSRC